MVKKLCSIHYVTILYNFRENYTIIGNDIGEIQLWDIPWNILK